MTELTTAPALAEPGDNDILPVRAAMSPGTKKLTLGALKVFLGIGGGGGGSGVPDGGTTGQVLGKLSDDDGDADWIDQTGGGGGGSGSSRIMASGRFDCSDVNNPVLVAGINVASIVKGPGFGLYRVNFTTPIDHTKAGYSVGGKFATFNGRATALMGLERENGKGLLADHVDFTALFQNNPNNIDDWFSFEIYDVSAQAGGGGGGGGSTTPSGRYWRIRTSGKPDSVNGDVGLTELQFKRNGFNQTGDGVAISSSNFDATYTAVKAFDGVITGDTGWFAQDNTYIGEWIGYDFGIPTAIDEVTIYPYNSTLSFNLRQWTVEYSDDGDFWRVAGRIEADAWAVDTPQSFAIPDIASASSGGGSEVGSHRYWGLMNMFANGGNLNVQSVAWFNDNVRIDPTDYFANAFFNNNAEFSPDNLLVDDGNRWATAGRNGWIGADFGTPVAIDKVGVVGLSNSEETMFTGQVAWSDDGRTWNTLTTITTTAWPTQTFQYWDVPTTR